MASDSSGARPLQIVQSAGLVLPISIFPDVLALLRVIRWDRADFRDGKGGRFRLRSSLDASDDSVIARKAWWDGYHPQLGKHRWALTV